METQQFTDERRFIPAQSPPADLVAERIDPAEPADPSINPPPEPVEPSDEPLAHIHAVLSQIVAAFKVLAVQVPTGHGMQMHFAGIEAGLAALFDRAHQK